MDNIIANKSFDFALDIIALYKDISIFHKEYILSKQILKSGTSIGANVREALRAQSKKDFISKMYIALKEAEETQYWLQLLIESNYLDEQKGNTLLLDCKTLSKILTSIIKTTQKNLTVNNK